MKNRYLVVVLVVALVGVVSTGKANAFSSGSITNAFANSEWTQARFNVAVSPQVCVGSGYCSYHVAAIASPNLPSYRCQSGQFGDSDPNTQVAWFGPTLTTNAPYSAAVTNAQLLNRVVGQRLCIELVGENEHVSAVCEAQKKVFEEFTGKPQPPCPLEKFFFQESVTGTLLTVEPLPAVIPPAPSAPAATPVKKPLVCPKGKRKVTRKGKKICVKIHRKQRHQKVQSAK